MGSGPLVILADLVLRIGPQPSFGQRVALFWFVTAVTCAGTCTKVCEDLIDPMLCFMLSMSSLTHNVANVHCPTLQWFNKALDIYEPIRLIYI